MKKNHYCWVIIAIVFSLNIISYIDRSVIAYATHDIIHQLHLSTTQMGIILGSFGAGYLVTTLYGGFLADRFAPKIIFLTFSLLWALSMLGTTLMIGFISGIIARFGLGLGEGPFFPSTARTISNWLTKESQGKALSNALVAVPISLAIGAPLATALILIIGWRWMFAALCVLILLWWPICFFFFKNAPNDDKKTIQAKGTKFTWGDLLKNKTMLSNVWGFFVYGFLLFFFISWLPYFLEKSYQLDIRRAGLFSILPWVAAAITLYLVGYVSDYIYKKTGNFRYALTYPIMIGQLLTILCIFPMIAWHNLAVTLTMLVLAVAFNLSNNTAFYSVNLKLQKNRSGSLLGIMNASFAISGFVAPAISGYLFHLSGNFHSVFYLVIALGISSLIFNFFCHQPDKDFEIK